MLHFYLGTFLYFKWTAKIEINQFFVIFVFMEVNDKMIDNLANLARLEFNDQEKTDIKKDLEKMIRFVEKLNELDTTGVAPLLHMSANLNILRQDEVTGSVKREEGLKNAPDHDSRFLLVPKVISKPDNAENNSDQP
jgi:aspartyl-tRNA(Asn)/glutamyl-tRNA(Gln) amidotransferase subunit C